MKSRLIVSLVTVLLTSMSSLASGEPTAQLAAQLKAKVVAIKQLAWDKPGVPSKSYKDALKRHSKLNPTLINFASNVEELTTASEQDETAVLLKKAALKLKQVATRFEATFGQLGVLIPPRVEKAIVDAQINELDQIRALLPEISQ